MAGNRLKEDVDKILEERGTSYGDFSGGALAMQRLKAVAHEHLSLNPNYQKMPNGHKAIIDEGIDMILHKIGRLCNGDPYHDDSWRDIAGYALLTLEFLEKDSII